MYPSSDNNVNRTFVGFVREMWTNIFSLYHIIIPTNKVGITSISIKT